MKPSFWRAPVDYIGEHYDAVLQWMEAGIFFLAILLAVAVLGMGISKLLTG